MTRAPCVKRAPSAMVAILFKPVRWTEHPVAVPALGGTVGALVAVILRLNYGFN